MRSFEGGGCVEVIVVVGPVARSIVLETLGVVEVIVGDRIVLDDDLATQGLLALLDEVS